MKKINGPTQRELEVDYRRKLMAAMLNGRIARLRGHLAKFPDDQQGVKRLEELEGLIQ